jgi:uncharacterized protein (TIGR03083 family)
MTSAAGRVTLLQMESTRLTQYLHALPQEAWSRPSACAQWQVQDVVAHLVGGAEVYAGSISRGLQGDTSPAAGPPPCWHTQCRLAGRGDRPENDRQAEAVG